MPMKKRTFGMLLSFFLFLWMVSGLNRGYQDQGRRQLEDALRRTAVSCYACQGFYPPSVAYMQEHYGLQFDEEAYIVRYHMFASNLMPDITVLEAAP